MRVLVVSLFVALHQLLLLAAFPRPTGYVNDFASILDEDAEAYLEDFLRTVERDTSAEIVVTTVASLEGRTVEDYANRLFSEWGIGKKQRDNGVLLLVAPTDRAVRIEVGYGLESILPDGLAGEIIRTEIIPEFRSGNYPRGVGRGLNRIAQVVRRDPAAVASTSPAPDGGGFPSTRVTVPFFGSFIVLGGFAAGLGWSWIGLLRNRAPRPGAGDEPVAWESGGSSSSSSGGSSDSAGSSSGSDFGGGSSGGGGASGRW